MGGVNISAWSEIFRDREPNQIIRFNEDTTNFDEVIADGEYLVEINISDWERMGNREQEKDLWAKLIGVGAIKSNPGYMKTFAERLESVKKQLNADIDNMIPLNIVFYGYGDDQNHIADLYIWFLERNIMPIWDAKLKRRITIYIGQSKINYRNVEDDFMNQLIRLKNEKFPGMIDKHQGSIKILDGRTLKSEDDFLLKMYQMYQMRYIELRNPNGLLDWLKDSYYIGEEGRPAILAIQYFDELYKKRKGLAVWILQLMDGYAGVLQYWDDEVISTSDEEYRQFTFVIGV